MVRRAAIIADDIEAIDHAFALSATNAAWKAERHAPRGVSYSTEGILVNSRMENWRRRTPLRREGARLFLLWIRRAGFRSIGRQEVRQPTWFGGWDCNVLSIIFVGAVSGKVISIGRTQTATTAIIAPGTIVQPVRSVRTWAT